MAGTPRSKLGGGISHERNETRRPCGPSVDGDIVVESVTSEGRAQEVVSSYVTFYGFDDNDDGHPTHLGTGIISNATIHGFANEDLGTYERPGTLATDASFLTPGTKVYVPELQRYYVMEDT